MTRRWISLMLVAAFLSVGAQEPTEAAPTSCTMLITVARGTSASCLFSVAGEQASVRGVSLAPGVSLSPYVPNPAITGLTVTVFDAKGQMLQRCSAYDYAVAACAKLGRIAMPTGTILRCVVNAWNDAAVGTGQGVFSCGNR